MPNVGPLGTYVARGILGPIGVSTSGMNTFYIGRVSKDSELFCDEPIQEAPSLQQKNLNLEGNMDHTKLSTQTHTNVTKHVHKPCRQVCRV